MEQNECDMELMGVLEDLGYQVPLGECKVDYDDCYAIAQHFYELGKNISMKDFKFPETDEEVEAFIKNAPKVEVPDKYKTCDWLWVYGKIGLKAEHITRLNNAINLLESLNEHTDAKYLKEIKDKLLADAPMQEKKATLRREYCNEERKLKQ